MDRSTILPEGERFIRERECLLLTGLSRTTRWRLERTGDFPKRLQLSSNCVGWQLSAVEDWMIRKIKNDGE